ncbi:MAG TPA: mannosyltransferase family protein [Ktedonobacterales bacterium]|nr:mannosyltransferase family protein [Ktedonobacterales bacterium]
MTRAPESPEYTVNHPSWRRAAPAVVEWARRRRDTLTPLAIALGIRLAVFLAASALMRAALTTKRPALRGVSLIEAWSRMDTDWYVGIAQAGYNYSPVIGSRANFFPLFPALMAIGGRAIEPLGLPSPWVYVVVGTAISWAAFAAACVALYQLALLRFDRRVAAGAVTLLAVFPFSFYYGVAYTEALYLLLAVLAFLAIERGNWWGAAGAAGLASALRPPGLILGACVALAYGLAWLRERRWLRRDMLSLALIPMGALAYTAYCWAAFGEPLAYIKTARAGWHEGLQLNALIMARDLATSPKAWEIIRYPHNWTVPKYLFITSGMAYLGLLAICLLTIPFVWRLLGPVYAIFVIVSAAAPLALFPSIQSLGRYLSVLFPVFIVLAYPLRRLPLLLYPLAGLSLAALCGYTAFFIGGFGLP